MDHLLCALIYLLVWLSRFAKALARAGLGSYEEWRPGEAIKLLLVGYNGARNTGSDVRVAAIARQVKEVLGKENVSVTVMTLDEESLAGYFDDDVTLLPFSSFFPWDMYRACCAHHAAILCEGSTLKSTFANALTLFMCEAAGIMSRQGKPCLAYGSEIGQMEPFLERAARRLCRDTYFITRTRDSWNALKNIGLKGHAGTDAAWSYDAAIRPGEADQLLQKKGWDGKKPLLGIAVIDPYCWPVRASMVKWLKGHISGDLSGQYDKWYFFSDSKERREAFRTYIREIASGIRSFMKDHDVFPVLIGMERLDEKACRALSQELGGTEALFLSGDCGAPVMTGILRRLSALVTSRYHAAVLSMERACPIVAVSMDERLDSLMKELRLCDPYLLHVGDEDLGRHLAGALSLAVQDKHSIGRHIQEETLRYRKELDNMGMFLKRYLEDALQKQ